MTGLAYDETAQAADGEDECPSWCVGCDETETGHANEYEGTSDPAPDSEWHALARTVQDHRGGPVLVELAVLDGDGNEAVVRMTPDQAAELAAAISFSTDCALRPA